MITCYNGVSEAVGARVGSAWKKLRELSGVLVGKQGLSLKQQGEDLSLLRRTSFNVLLWNVGTYYCQWGEVVWGGDLYDKDVWGEIGR